MKVQPVSLKIVYLLTTITYGLFVSASDRPCGMQIVKFEDITTLYTDALLNEWQTGGTQWFKRNQHYGQLPTSGIKDMLESYPLSNGVDKAVNATIAFVNYCNTIGLLKNPLEIQVTDPLTLNQLATLGNSTILHFDSATAICLNNYKKWNCGSIAARQKRLTLLFDVIQKHSAISTLTSKHNHLASTMVQKLTEIPTSINTLVLHDYGIEDSKLSDEENSDAQNIATNNLIKVLCDNSANTINSLTLNDAYLVPDNWIRLLESLTFNKSVTQLNIAHTSIHCMHLFENENVRNALVDMLKYNNTLENLSFDTWFFSQSDRLITNSVCQAIAGNEYSHIQILKGLIAAPDTIVAITKLAKAPSLKSLSLRLASQIDPSPIRQSLSSVLESRTDLTIDFTNIFLNMSLTASTHNKQRKKTLLEYASTQTC